MHAPFSTAFRVHKLVGFAPHSVAMHPSRHPACDAQAPGFAGVPTRHAETTSLKHFEQEESLVMHFEMADPVSAFSMQDAVAAVHVVETVPSHDLVSAHSAGVAAGLESPSPRSSSRLPPSGVDAIAVSTGSEDWQAARMPRAALTTRTSEKRQAMSA